jgi:hypothetical protein
MLGHEYVRTAKGELLVHPPEIPAPVNPHTLNKIREAVSPEQLFSLDDFRWQARMDQWSLVYYRKYAVIPLSGMAHESEYSIRVGAGGCEFLWERSEVPGLVYPGVVMISYVIKESLVVRVYPFSDILPAGLLDVNKQPGKSRIGLK